jgi:hypothetical protein
MLRALGGAAAKDGCEAARRASVVVRRANMAGEGWGRRMDGLYELNDGARV